MIAPVAMAMAMALILCGCNSEKPQPAPARANSAGAQVLGTENKVYALGERAAARDYTMSVESVEPCTVAPPFAPKNGHEKLGVTVVVEAISDRQVPANPFYATLKDGNDTVYASTLAGCKPPLTARVLGRGEKQRGIITFEVPISATRLEMRYAPAIIGGGRQELRFDLGR